MARTARPARRVDLKTKAGRRDIALAGKLESYLRDHLRATAQSSHLPRSDAYVFVTASGTPLNRNNVAKRGLDRAAEAAGLNGDHVPKLGFHNLRHTFASHLIRAGVDPVRASRQLGHARPSITLDIYAHEFEHARGLDDVRDSIDAAFGASRI